MPGPQEWGAVEDSGPEAWGAQAVDAPEDHTYAATAIRMAKEGMRAVDLGIAQIFDTVTSPLQLGAYGLRKLAGSDEPIPSPAFRSAMENTLERAGAGRAESGAGRIGQDLGENIVGTTAQVLAYGSNPVTAPLAVAPLVQLGSTIGATLGGSGAREAGLPRWAQVAGGVAGGLAGGNVAEAITGPPSTATQLLLKDREASAATTDAEVQTSLQADYQAAKAPFDTEYAKLRAQGVQVIPSKFNDIAAANETSLKLSPEMSGSVNRVKGLATPSEHYQQDVMSFDAAQQSRSHLLDQARAATRAGKGDEARVFNQLAAGLQDDIDGTLLTKAATEVSTKYREQVIGPFGEVRKALGVGVDPEEAWKALQNAGKSDLKRLASAASPETVLAIRRRMARDIIEREASFGTLQSGSGAPVFRAFQRNGMEAFFTPKEWKGLARVTGRLAAVRNPFNRTVGAGVGAVAGSSFGPVGSLSGAVMAGGLEYLVTTPTGRRALEGAIAMTTPQLDAELTALAMSPIIRQAEPKK